uniref:Serpentine receptor class gamma n=1 Tax=Caenorhabditis japonica TaxID=281687 RepID=A0A8R1HPC4_CAEJA
MNVSDRGIGKKLTRIALMYTTVYSGILLWSDLSVLNTWFGFIPQTVMQLYVPTMTFASDLMTLALPYILLIFDTNIRKDITRKNRSPVATKVIASLTIATTQL